MVAERVAATEEGIARAAHALASGGLVAFPTETVYGLGARALDERAVSAIFAAKGRPATDPLIVHCATATQARALALLDAREGALFDALAQALWPGPLTLVATAHPSVPSRVRAGGPSVGLRVPAHPIARALVTRARVPVAAPSANRFGHVSPTTADHVLDDLGAVEGLIVLDGGACPVGIESTVLRLAGDGPLEVLRRGGVSVDAIARVVAPLGAEVVARSLASRPDVAQAAPGQLESHYAPSLPTWLLAARDDRAPPAAPAASLPLADCALLDLGGRLADLAPGVRTYLDVSPTGAPAVAMAELFAGLRRLERSGARAILLVDLGDAVDERLLAIHDRLRRAAAGARATLSPDRSHALVPA